MTSIASVLQELEKYNGNFNEITSFELAVPLTRLCGPTYQLTIRMRTVSIALPCFLHRSIASHGGMSTMIIASVASASNGHGKALWPNLQYTIFIQMDVAAIINFKSG